MGFYELSEVKNISVSLKVFWLAVANLIFIVHDFPLGARGAFLI